MLFAVHHRAVVDLIRKYDQIVLPRQFHDLLQKILRIQRAGRIVRVDDHDPLRPVRDLPLHITYVWIPAGTLITQIMYGISAGQLGRCRPERIIRRRDQYFIAIVQKSLHRDRNQFADAISQINMILTDIWKSFFLMIIQDRQPRLQNPLRITVPLAHRIL